MAERDKWGVAFPDWDGAALIASERKRQINEEGRTREHDAEHDDGSLGRAGACYADDIASVIEGSNDPNDLGPHPFWPWPDGWKPTHDDPIRQLVKAGALLAAEIDRLLRPDGAPDV